MNEMVVGQGAQLVTQQRITGDLYSRFLSYVDAKPKTIETYTRALRQFFGYLSANGIDRPTRESVLAFRDSLKESHKPSTVQNYVTATRLFFRWTEQEGLYKNIADHIKGASISRDHKKDYLTSKQVKAILGSISRTTETGRRDYAIMALMITGGLRTVEVSRANLEDLRTLGDDTVLYIQGKGRDEKTDYAKLADPVDQAIRDYLKERGILAGDSPLFCSTSNNNQGERLTTRSISGIVKARLRAAGFDSERLTAHSLRHTAGTLNLLNGGTLEETQQLLRHSKLDTTMIYLHHMNRSKNKSEERISNAIF
jgi:integrase/recombinase XerD